jgi:CRP-like cAMP-binding protein
LAKHFYIILKGSVYVLTPFLSTDTVEDKLEKIFKNPNEDEKMLIKENSSLKVAVVLGAGKSFGDTALANRINRTATIVCKETCFFASLN